METRNLLGAEFKTLVIRMLNELRRRVDEFYENFNIEKGNKNGGRKCKKDQSEMKNIIMEMKNVLEEISSRVAEAEHQISDLEDKVAENTQSEDQKEKNNKKMRIV